MTDLGAKAHEELLTESLRNKFEDELKALGKNIEVKLVKVRSSKGKLITRLEILHNNVRDILSEGEQKAVGIALFIAEAESQNMAMPIVFDDPVNSLDHEVGNALAKRILELALNHQVIIFTHHKFFFDSLTSWAGQLRSEKNEKYFHICKNYSNGCSEKGMHIYTYKVDREAKDKTGKITEAQLECSDYFISKAEQELKGSYSVSSVSGNLKSAVEYYIDEKILNNQELLKDRKNKAGINWDGLKKINPDSGKIDLLKTHWDNLSSRGSHLASGSIENPLKLEDFNKIISFLKN